MDVVAQMLQARPESRGVDHTDLAIAIDALHEAVGAATSCADACLSEVDVTEHRACIQACADAADVAAATARVLCRSGPTINGSRALVDATAKLLSEASSICAEHGVDDKHARICADALSRAERALAGLQTAIAAASSDS